MKVYKQVPEDAEYREYYDSYRVTVENLNDTDFLYKSSLTNGQVFFETEEVYGFVNNQAAVRGRNLTITKEYIDDFVIKDFKVYTRATNELLDININVNLKDYRDSKPHYLYIVLSHNGTYEVYDDMFQSDETKIVFARFIIDKQGNSKQFYMMLPFAGSADYIKGNQFYQVTDGLRINVVNTSTKQLTLTNAKVRFSGINFDDVSSPDCLEIKFDGNAVPIRYASTWDNTSKVPRVDWDSSTVDSLDLTKIMSYNSGSTSAVDEGKWSIQKLYFDVYTKNIIALYGNKVYDSKTDAIYSIDSVMDYTLPDGIEYLIPIAAVLAENTSSAITEDNFKIVNLDYNEKEVLDSDTFTRQQSAEAVQKANKALDTANEVEETLENHTGDRTNPHQVRLDQLYNSSGNKITLDDSYADWTVSSILAKAANSAAEIYYRKDGGTISGNVVIGSESSAKNLTVYGSSTLKGTVSIGSTLTVGGNISTNSMYDIGSSSSRFGTIYSQSINTNSDSTIGGKLTTRALIPDTTLTYDIGSSDKRYSTMYSKFLDISSNSTISGNLSVGGTLSVSGNTTLNKLNASRIEVSNGYIIVGGYSLRLGGSGSIPTQNGYGIW
jgi:hypothetical protein